MNLEALEHAWLVIKAKEDAPNYRKATGPKNAATARLGILQRPMTP